MSDSYHVYEMRKKIFRLERKHASTLETLREAATFLNRTFDIAFNDGKVQGKSEPLLELLRRSNVILNEHDKARAAREGEGG